MIFFKYLVKNDIGENSHQAGPVIPQKCLDYFPYLRTDRISKETPTESAFLGCSLFVDGNFKAFVTTRFQFQTWGGTRPPEHRITGGLTSIMAAAVVGDLLIGTKISSEEYRLDLHTNKSPYRQELDKIVQTRIDNGLKFNTKLASGLINFAVISQEPVIKNAIFVDRKLADLTTSQRTIRDPRFRQKLLDAYSIRCAISGERLHVPNTNLTELEGAHIIPVGSNGSDEVVNGLLLNRRLHWAFDRGMFKIDNSFKVVIASSVLASPENIYLHQFHNADILLPKQEQHHPSKLALDWHRQNVNLPS